MTFVFPIQVAKVIFVLPIVYKVVVLENLVVVMKIVIRVIVRMMVVKTFVWRITEEAIKVRGNIVRVTLIVIRETARMANVCNKIEFKF